MYIKALETDNRLQSCQCHVVIVVASICDCVFVLSPDRLTVSCSSEQYDLEFIFSLDTNVLIQTRANSPEKQSISNATMSLHGQLMGKLMCMIVQNNVSREQTTIHLTGCSGITVVVFLSSFVQCLLLLLLLKIINIIAKEVLEFEA